MQFQGSAPKARREFFHATLRRDGKPVLCVVTGVTRGFVFFRTHIEPGSRVRTPNAWETRRNFRALVGRWADQA